jgi:hypothetical protein
MVDQQAAQLQALAAMSDAHIDAYAQAAAAKIVPLLSVQREFIEAAFDAIDTIGLVNSYVGTTPSERVVEFLIDPIDGLGLTTNDIDTLRSLYLE